MILDNYIIPLSCQHIQNGNLPLLFHLIIYQIHIFLLLDIFAEHFYNSLLHLYIESKYSFLPHIFLC